MSNGKTKLTDKVNYTNASEMSEAQIKLVNMLSEKEPSCYWEIADIILEQTASLTTLLKTSQANERRMEHDYARLEGEKKEVEAERDGYKAALEEIASYHNEDSMYSELTKIANNALKN